MQQSRPADLAGGASTLLDESSLRGWPMPVDENGDKLDDEAPCS